MKEFERTETDLENKVADAQKRYDIEQTKVLIVLFDEYFELNFVLDQ